MKTTNKITAVIDESNTTEFAPLKAYNSIEDLHADLTRLIIKFDNNPDYYTKKDYYLLISVLTGGLDFINSNSSCSANFEKLRAEIDEIRETVSKITGTNPPQDDNAGGGLSGPSQAPDYITLSSLNDRLESLEKILAGLLQSETPLNGGSGITIEDNTIHAKLKEDIQVYGVNIGNIKNNTTISGDTTIVDLLKQMLLKEVNLQLVSLPSVTFSPTAAEIAYGDSYTATFTFNLNQGTYTSEDPSIYNESGDFNLSISNVFKGDVWEGEAPEKNSNGVWTVKKAYKNVRSVISDDLDIAYDLSAPKKVYSNTNTLLDLGVNTGGNVTGTFTLTPLVYGYIGTGSIKSFNVINEVKIPFPLSKSVTLSGPYNTYDDVLLIIPTDYSLKSAEGALGQSITELFVEQKDLDLSAFGPYPYKAYMMNNLTKESFTCKNIKLEK